jgi:hypothetical protein
MDLTRLEHRSEPVASRGRFLWRLGANLVVAAALIAISLLAGMLGYRNFEGMSWLDAFANAAMILSGMGPLQQLVTSGGKLFAGFYAIYSGLFLVLIAGLVLAPVVHRILHRLNVEDDDDERTARRPAKGGRK